MVIKNFANKIKKHFIRLQNEIMAPVKFGLFKARSRDYQEQPSTENLLHTSNSSDHVGTPSSPLPSTSKGLSRVEDEPFADLSVLQLDSEDDDNISQHGATPTRRISECSRLDDSQINYQPLKNQASTDATSISTLNTEGEGEGEGEGEEHTLAEQEDGATSCDAMSLQFDDTSLAASEDLSVYCGGTLRRNKRSRREEKQLRDFDMWQASNVEVMQNLLSRSGTLDEQIKWEAIATARGLCTLTDGCACDDCARAKYRAPGAGVADGDGGLGAAPLFNAISVGCQLQ